MRSIEEIQRTACIKTTPSYPGPRSRRRGSCWARAGVQRCARVIARGREGVESAGDQRVHRRECRAGQAGQDPVRDVKVPCGTLTGRSRGGDVFCVRADRRRAGPRATGAARRSEAVLHAVGRGIIVWTSMSYPRLPRQPLVNLPTSATGLPVPAPILRVRRDTLD